MQRKQTGILPRQDAVLLILQLLFLIGMIGAKLHYLALCGCILLWLHGFRMLGSKHSRAWLGATLILPGLALCGVSAVPLLVPMMPDYDLVQTILVCAMVGLQAIGLVFSLVIRWPCKEAGAWTMRHFDAALLCGQMTALVAQLLLLEDAGEWAQMVCLTGGVLGGVIVLLGCNLTLCTLCQTQSTKAATGMLRKAVQDRRRTLHFVTVGKDGFMVLVKLGMSLVSLSFFMFANALFSCGIGLARYTALQMQGKDSGQQVKLYRRVSGILSFSGICYVAYSVRLFFGGSAGQYDMVMALAIAAYTFVEFGIQIYDLIKLRKQHDLEAKALRLVSLCGILVSFVLTQTAIMSFSAQGEHNFSDGLAGVVFGGLVVLVGLIMALRSLRMKKIFSDY